MTATALDFEWHGYTPGHYETPEAPPPGDPVPTDPIPGLAPLLYWPLNEAAGAGVAADASSAHTYPGTVMGGTTLGVAGKSGTTAAHTPADSSFAAAAGSGIQNNAFTRADFQFSVSLWFRTTSTNGFLLTTSLPGTTFGGVALQVLAANRVTFKVNGGGSGKEADTNVVTGMNVSDNNWHHIVGVKTATSMLVYVDGVLRKTSASTATPTTPARFNVGRWVNGGGTVVADYQRAAYFDRALTAAEVADLAAFTVLRVPASPPPPVPVWVPGAWFLDPVRTSALVNYKADHGRTDPASAAKPSTCSVLLGAARSPVAPDLGEPFRLTLGPALLARLGITAADAPRFTGEVTDAVTDPAKRVHQITAVGKWARSSRIVLDGRGWVTEDDGNRVARVLGLTRSAEDVGVIDAGTSDLLPPKGSASAGQLIDAAFASTTGNLLEQRTGKLDWHDAEHRRASPILLTLDASELLNDFTWTKRVGDLLNDATVTANGSAIRVRDGQSVDDRGAYPQTIATALKDTSDAYSLGTLLVSRYGRPSYQLPAVVVDLLRTVLTDDRRKVLAQLRHGDRIKLTGLPAMPDAGAATELVVFVEGVTEQVWRQPADAWRLTFAVSEASRSGVSLRWSDAPTALTWDGVDPALSWLDLARIDDPADLT